MSRRLYEVRVRELNGSKSVKKSKFYTASDPREAIKQYDGKGHIMWVQKAGKEKLLGIGEFFTMGDRLLKEFLIEGGEKSLLQKQHDIEKNQVRLKRKKLLIEKKEYI